MLEIKLTVEAPALTEALNKLAGAMDLCAAGSTNKVAAKETKTAECPVTEKITEDTNTTESTSATTPPTNPQPTPQPVPTTTATQEEAKSYTLNEISNAGAALVEQGKMGQVIALLQKYGVQTIVQLDPSVYNAVAAELKALGAAL